MKLQWTPDSYGCLNLNFDGPNGPVHVWIAPRPSYCDRGHWEFNVEADCLDLDGSDSFPRYFMDLQTAITEANRWLNWRLYDRRHQFPEKLLRKDEGALKGIDLSFNTPEE